MKTRKKFLSLFLTFILTLSLLPMTGLAYAVGDGSGTSVSSTFNADLDDCNTLANIGNDRENSTGATSPNVPLLEEDEIANPILKASQSDGLDTNPGEVLIPFTKVWSGENATTNTRPESITIKLYKYIETFDTSSATLIETVVLTAEDDWKCTFDITSEVLYDSNNNAYKFAIVEDLVPGYTETSHTTANSRIHFLPNILP